MQIERNARLFHEILDFSGREAFRDANFVEIEVAEASHSKAGVNALLCQRHDLQS